MAVPDYQSVMLPLLQFAEERKAEISTDDAVESLATRLGLTDDDLKEVLPSGVQRTFVNRVGWATTYMKKAGCWNPHVEAIIESPHADWNSSRRNLQQ